MYNNDITVVTVVMGKSFRTLFPRPGARRVRQSDRRDLPIYRDAIPGMTDFFVQVSHDDNDDPLRFQHGNYRAMQLDESRMVHYRRDIERLSAGARILEIGPGPLATLTELCLAAGAREVFAVEMCPWAAEAARAALAADRRATVLTMHTDALRAADVGGDRRFDLLLHECYGCVAAGEGVVEAVAALHANGFVFGRVVSRGFETLVAPCALPPAAQMAAPLFSLSGLRGGGDDSAAEAAVLRASQRAHVQRVDAPPASMLLAPPQVCQFGLFGSVTPRLCIGDRPKPADWGSLRELRGGGRKDRTENIHTPRNHAHQAPRAAPGLAVVRL